MSTRYYPDRVWKGPAPLAPGARRDSDVSAKVAYMAAAYRRCVAKTVQNSRTYECATCADASLGNTNVTCLACVTFLDALSTENIS